ncbi:tetratricopeptide repeat protein, partial [Caulobacter sp. 17J65-9]|uniref:tetratricopeptide repeat protein n=1 Tax=Caulobacter sp. 17J65-9 TaxID=2709382 RepID=UPI0013C5C704|nr:tetratricopeptide repeat protein [Caulobacter sp. 17J65-9]
MIAGGPTSAQLAEQLLAQGRVDEALRLTAELANAPAVSANHLQLHAEALKAAGRHEEAAESNRRATLISPQDRIAWHNYASVLGDLNRNDEAKAAAERAIKMGLEAPETRLVYGRALLGLGKLDEAEAAYRDALFRRPAYGEAHRDLAQLIWMRTADVDAALKPLDRADPQNANAELASVRALVLDRGGRPREAYEVLNAAIARHPGDPRLRLSAAQAAADLGEDAAAVRLAESVAQVAPGVPAVEEALCTVYL